MFGFCSYFWMDMQCYAVDFRLLLLPVLFVFVLNESAKVIDPWYQFQEELNVTWDIEKFIAISRKHSQSKVCHSIVQFLVHVNDSRQIHAFSILSIGWFQEFWVRRETDFVRILLGGASRKCHTQRIHFGWRAQFAACKMRIATSYDSFQLQWTYSIYYYARQMWTK